MIVKSSDSDRYSYSYLHCRGFRTLLIHTGREVEKEWGGEGEGVMA